MNEEEIKEVDKKLEDLIAWSADMMSNSSESQEIINNAIQAVLVCSQKGAFDTKTPIKDFINTLINKKVKEEGKVKNLGLTELGSLIGMELHRQCQDTNAKEAKFKLKGKVGDLEIVFRPKLEKDTKD